jgi:prepilin-type N-terminal cleavage/methylation domain-containing protein
MFGRRSRGGRRRRGLVARAGFTIIELFMVMAVLAILAALMIEHISQLKQKAFIATMQSDLRTLETAEEGYFIEFSIYTPTLLTDRYTPTTGDTFTITSASVTGWSAVVTYSNALGVTSCHMAVGSAETTASEWPGAPYCP